MEVGEPLFVGQTGNYKEDSLGHWGWERTVAN